MWVGGYTVKPQEMEISPESCRCGWVHGETARKWRYLRRVADVCLFVIILYSAACGYDIHIPTTVPVFVVSTLFCDVSFFRSPNGQELTKNAIKTF